MSRKKAAGISVLTIVFMIVSQMAAGIAANGLVMIGVSAGIGNIVYGVLYLVFSFILIKICVEKIFHLELPDMGITKLSVKPVWLITALLLPLLVTACYLVFFKGELISTAMNRAQLFETVAGGIIYTGIAAGFVEEMVFRGVIFHSLEKAWNTKVAVLVPSVLFAALHILGMEFSIGSCLLVIIAGTAVGIMFSLITIESGSVWCSGLVHALWNTIIIGGILSVGENVKDGSVMSYVLENKSFPVTGGEFGIESSVVAVIGYVIVSALAVLMIRKKQAAAKA